jgi:hypothetical protein
VHAQPTTSQLAHGDVARQDDRDAVTLNDMTAALVQETLREGLVT